MSDIIKTLVEMGFSQKKSEMAVAKTNGRDVQDAMEWLLAHPDDEEEASTQSTTNSTETDATKCEETPENSEDAPEAKSLKCDECGRLFKTHEEVEFHAAKSGHSSFSESTEEKKPLSEEEKIAQKARLEELMKQKRREREEKERQEVLEREKNRIRSGKEITEARRKQEDIEMKKIIELRKKEKEEAKMAKQRVREQIEQDKLARKAKAEAAQGQVQIVAPPPAPLPTSTCNKAPNKTYTEARIQIRLTNGNALTYTFGAKEPLSAVRLYVEMNRTDEPGPFSLMTSFPRKVFSAEDYDKPLDVLGLAPAAVIIVTKV